VIRLEALSRHYRTGNEVVAALDGVDLTIERAEFLAIMGASGSGKSTLMNVIGCLDRPTGGRYLFDDHDVGRMNDALRTRLRAGVFGFVFQQYNLLPRMNAVEQVELPLVYRKANHRRARARAALTAVGLEDRFSHKPNQMSGGQQQRVAIARALVANPRVILADEPTGALDSRTGEEIMALLEDLVRTHRITVILVTHEQSVADHADRIVRMRDGKIVEDVRRRVRAVS